MGENEEFGKDIEMEDRGYGNEKKRDSGRKRGLGGKKKEIGEVKGLDGGGRRRGGHKARGDGKEEKKKDSGET